MDKAQTIVLALKNINSKAKQDPADVAEAENWREDWMPLFELYEVLEPFKHVSSPIEFL